MSEISAPSLDDRALTGLNFLRPHRRVVVFLFVAPFFYEVWWYWQLFRFADRERFPRARRFWWLLVPIYGWVVLYREFDDLDDAAPGDAPSVRPALAIWLVIFSWWAGGLSNRTSNDYGAYAAFLVSGLLISIVGSLVQRPANAYLRARYGDAEPRSMTAGEIAAAVLGLLLFAVVTAAFVTSRV